MLNAGLLGGGEVLPPAPSAPGAPVAASPPPSSHLRRQTSSNFRSRLPNTSRLTGVRCHPHALSFQLIMSEHHWTPPRHAKCTRMLFGSCSQIMLRAQVNPSHDLADVASRQRKEDSAPMEMVAAPSWPTSCTTPARPSGSTTCMPRQSSTAAAFADHKDKASVSRPSLRENGFTKYLATPVCSCGLIPAHLRGPSNTIPLR